MGALPQFQPSTLAKKPAARAHAPKPAERCKTRSLPEIQAEFRSRTNYAEGTGYVPVFHALMEDLIRLSSGRVCDWIVFYSLQNCSLRIPRKGSPADMPPEAELSVTELAVRIGCEERSINRELEYLKTRGMAVIARLADSRFVITLLFQDWAQIEQSYADWRNAQAKPAAAPDDDVQDDETALEVKKGRVELTPAPVAVKPGRQCRKIPVKCGVRSVRVHWENKVLALQFSAVIDSGDLVITGDVPDASRGNSNAGAKSSVSTTSGRTSGHTCPENAKTPANGGSAPKGERTAKVKHPRAAELAEIFDPLCLKSSERTLSGDAKYWQQACDNIGNVPADFIERFMRERKRRPLQPSHVPAICLQLAHDYPRTGRRPSKPQFTRQETIQDLEWLVVNGWTETDRADAERQLAELTGGHAKKGGR